MLFLLRESERVWLLIQLYECSTIYKHCWETTIHLCGNAVLHVFGVLSMEDFLYTDQACILKYVVPHLYMTPPRALGRRTTEDRGWPWRKFCTPPSPSGPRPPWQTRQHHLSCHPEICISWTAIIFYHEKMKFLVQPSVLSIIQAQLLCYIMIKKQFKSMYTALTHVAVFIYRQCLQSCKNAWKHTTIMAILPPTSPTTFSGGFSFGRRAEMLQRHKHGYQIKSCIKLNSLSVLMKYNNGSHKYSHWNKGLLSLYQWAKCEAMVIYIPSIYIP